MADPVEAFKDQLEAQGLGRPDVVPDGRLHRFDTPGDKRGRKSGWLIYHPEGVPSGAFGSWKSGESHKWSHREVSSLGPEEREEFRRRMAQARWARQEARQAEQEAARERAESIWEKAEPERGDHPYLLRKDVLSYGLRRYGDALLVPARDVDGELRTLAFIDPAGAKRYLAGGGKAGCIHLIGEPDGLSPIGLAEGYATAASVHAATGFPLVVAFDAGNLPEAARTTHRNYPGCPLVVFGDDDHETAGNPGRRQALAAAEGVNGRAVFPPDLQPGESDWNDLCQRVGVEAVGKLITDLLADGGGSPDDDFPSARTDNLDEYGTETHRRGCYAATSTGVWLLREGRDGNDERYKLTNFTALITGRTFLDDGVEWNEQYELTCRCQGRQTVVTVPATQFSSLGWAYRLGPGAIVSAGLMVKDRARVAIQSLSLGETRENHVFVHTGWAHYKKQKIFLHALGAIGPDGPVPGVTVELPEPLAGFAFQDIPSAEETPACTRKVLHLLESGSPANLVPLVAGVFRSVLGEVDFGIHLTGRTGSGKSELAARIQSFFGRRMDPRRLPGSWASTGNCNERYAFMLKDCMFVVDDFAPETGTDGAHLHREAARLFRAIGNHAGRGRLNSDLTIRQARPPRGLVLSTGEDVPKGQSIRARLVLLEMDPPPRQGSAERQRISRVWAQCAEDAADGSYERCLAAFVQWVAGNHDRILERRARLARDFRNHFLQLGDHLRAPSAFAELAAGYRIFLDFAREKGAISDPESARLWADAWEIFTAGVVAQADYQRMADPVDKFFDLLSAALGSGRAHLAGPRGETPVDFLPWGWRMDSNGARPTGDRIGWIDGRDIYLEPSVAYDVLQKLAGDERLPLSKDTLWRRIHERGFLLSTTPNRGLKVRRILEGRQREVLHLSTENLSGGDVEKNPTNPTFHCNSLIVEEKSMSGSLSGVGKALEETRQFPVTISGPENPEPGILGKPDRNVGECRVTKPSPDSDNYIWNQLIAEEMSGLSGKNEERGHTEIFTEGVKGEWEPPPGTRLGDAFRPP